MKFLAEERLWLLIPVGTLVAAYFMAQARRRRDTVRFTDVALLASVAPKRPGWRRHLPAAAPWLRSACSWSASPARHGR